MKPANMSDWVRCAGVVLMIGCLVVPGQLRAQPGQTPAAQSLRWKMKYLGGSEPRPKGTLEVTFEGDALVGAAGKRVVLSIPLAAITEVASQNNRGHHAMAAGFRTAGRLPMWILKNPGNSSGDGQLAAAFLTVYMVYGFVPTFVAASIAHRARERYVVHITWDEDSVTRGAAFELRPAAYESFLTHLQQATGKDWTNLAVQKQRLLQAKDTAQAIRIPNRVRVAGFELKPGAYQLVLLETEDDQGELYFIAGKKMDTRRIAASVPVEILRNADVDGTPPLTLGGLSGNTIQEVRLTGKTLRVKFAAQEPASPSPESNRPPN